jgi:peptide/nickel transport system substrate-binding protein
MERCKKICLVILLGCLISTLLSGMSFSQTRAILSQYNSPLEYQRATGKKITGFNEAPQLAELVKQGKLPPVSQRLPKNPPVVIPIEKVGKYGGTIRVVIPSRTVGAATDISYANPWEGILKFGRDGYSIEPNLAERWTWRDGGKTLILYLRKGVKWSDGEPFTADDIMFWYEDIVLNDELTPLKPVQWSPGGKLMKVEKIDDYTVQLKFAVPYPFATLYLAHYAGQERSFFYPKHFLKKYHPRYTPIKDLEAQAKKEGYDTWYKLFSFYADAMFPNAPTLKPFIITQATTSFVTCERNPYYWKVDIEGNQLPYIDRVYASIVTDPEVRTMKIATGEVDFALTENSILNYPLYMTNKDKAGYRVLLWNTVYGSEVFYQVNQTYAQDPVLRNIFRDVRFRKALSLAINRDEINEVLYHGLGTPRQPCPLPDSPYYVEGLDKLNTEFDLNKANALLDEMGLKKGPDGIRLRPDGKPLEVTIEYTQWLTPNRQTTELVKAYWEKLGIRVAVKEHSNELQTTRAQGNLIQIGLWHADRCAGMFIVEPYWWIPIRYGWEISGWSAWSLWYASGGKSGEEPPKDIKKLINTYEKIRTTMSEKERIRLAKEMLKYSIENVFGIGTVGLVPRPVIAKNNLRNVPEKGLLGYDVAWAKPYNTAQFFFEK